MTRNGWLIGGALIAAVATGCSSKKGHEGYSSVGAKATVVSGGVLLEGRDGHAVAPIGSGELLVIGGATASLPASDTLERYDPQSGWSTPLQVRLGTPRVGHLAQRLPDGRIWIAGGFDPDGVVLSTSELFDPRSNSLQPGPVLQSPRAFACVAVEGTQCVVAGGTSRSAEVWDLSALAPVGLIPLPGPEQLRGSLAAGGAQTWILAGARDAVGSALQPLWIDVATGVAELATERFVEKAPAVTLPTSKRVFLVAGRLDTRPSAAFQRVERGQADPVFDDGYRVLEVRDYPSAHATEDGVLIVGGVAVQGPDAPLASVEWVTAEGSSSVNPLLVARRDAVLSELSDGRVVITGGRGTGGRPVAVVEIFLPGDASGPNRFAAASQRAAQSIQTRQDLAQAQAEVVRLNRALASTQQQLAQAQQALAAAQADLATRIAQLQALNQQIVQLTQQLNLAQQAAQAAGGTNTALQARVNDLQFRLTSSQQAFAQAIQERDAARNSVFVLQASLKATQAQVQALQAQLLAKSAATGKGARGAPVALPRGK